MSIEALLATFFLLVFVVVVIMILSQYNRNPQVDAGHSPKEKQKPSSSSPESDLADFDF